MHSLNFIERGITAVMALLYNVVPCAFYAIKGILSLPKKGLQNEILVNPFFTAVRGGNKSTWVKKRGTT